MALGYGYVVTDESEAWAGAHCNLRALQRSLFPDCSFAPCQSMFYAYVIWGQQYEMVATSYG